MNRRKKIRLSVLIIAVTLVSSLSYNPTKSGKETAEEEILIPTLPPPTPSATFDLMCDLNITNYVEICPTNDSWAYIDSTGYKIEVKDHNCRNEQWGKDFSPNKIEKITGLDDRVIVIDENGDIYTLYQQNDQVHSDLIAQIYFQTGDEILDLEAFTSISESENVPVIFGVVRKSSGVYFFRTTGFAELTWVKFEEAGNWPGWSDSDDYRIFIDIRDREYYYLENLDMKSRIKYMFIPEQHDLIYRSGNAIVLAYDLVDSCSFLGITAYLGESSGKLRVFFFNYDGVLVFSGDVIWTDSIGPFQIENFHNYLAILTQTGIRLFDYNYAGDVVFYGQDPLIFNETRDEIVFTDIFEDLFIGWGYSIPSPSINTNSSAFKFKLNGLDLTVALNIGTYIKNQTSTRLCFSALKYPEKIVGGWWDFYLDDDDPTGPLIQEINFEPFPDYLNNQYILQVNSHVIDPESGVKNVSLYYKFSEDNLQFHEMTQTPNKPDWYNTTFNPWAIIGQNSTGLGIEAVNLDWDVMFEGDRDYSSQSMALNINQGSPVDVEMHHCTVTYQEKILAFRSKCLVEEWEDLEISYFGLYFPELNKYFEIQTDPKGFVMSGFVDLESLFPDSFPNGFYTANVMIIAEKWGLKYLVTLDELVYFTDIQKSGVTIAIYILIMGILVSAPPVYSYLIRYLKDYIKQKHQIREFNRDLDDFSRK